MSFTYDNPSASNKDAIRFLVGDTKDAGHLLEDEEIEYLISRWAESYTHVEYVASVAAETIAAKFAREANFSADGVSVSLANLAQQFRELAISLRQQYKNLLVGGVPDVGGIAPGEQTDPDIAPFDFGSGMHDNHEAGRQQYGNRSYPEYIPEYNPGV